MLRIIFGMPLNAKCECGRVRDADRLDCSICRDTFDHDALTSLQNALTVKRVDPSGIRSQEAGEGTVLGKPDLVAIGENDVRVGMDLAGRQSRRAVVQPAR